MNRSIAVVLALFAMTASPAAAQTLIERITPVGLSLVEVTAPDDVRLPVRLSYARSPQAAVEVWVDVLSAPDEAEALRRAEWQARTAAAGIAARAGLGDRAWGDRGMLVFARDRWVVEVRVVGGAHDAIAIATRVDAMLGTARSSAGAPTMRVEAPQGDVPGAVRFDGDVIAAWVGATGAAYARQTPRGWAVVRTGPGPFEVTAIAVTADLRAHPL